MKRILVTCAISLFMVACSSPIAQNSADPLANLAREYPQWTRLFDAPRNVSMDLMLLCRLILENEQSYLDSEHAQYFVQVYVNPSGEKTIRESGARTFLDGTIVVKEKWKRDASWNLDTNAMKPAGLGIMLKHGDSWEYAYVDESGKITRDQTQLEHCRACHEKNVARDAVFYPAVMQ